MMKPKQLECCRMCRMPVRRRRAWRRSGVEWASLLTKPANNSFSPESDVDIVQDLLQLLLLDTDFTSSESPCRLPSAEHVQYTYLACACSCWSIVRRKHRTRSPFLAPTRHALGRGVAIFTSASRYFTPGTCTCTHGTIAERHQRSACSPTPAASTYSSIAPSEKRPISLGSFSVVLRHTTGSVQVPQASLENHTFDRHALLKHNL